MIVAVVGSRTYNHWDHMLRVITDLEEAYGPFLHIQSGAARGADGLAVSVCKYLGVSYEEFPAKWKRPDGSIDRGAGYKRNISIVKDADLVIAFWDGLSRGTRHSIDLATEMKIPLEIIGFYIDGFGLYHYVGGLD